MQKPVTPTRKNITHAFYIVKFVIFIPQKASTEIKLMIMNMRFLRIGFEIIWYAKPKITEPIMVSELKPIGIYPVNA